MALPDLPVDNLYKFLTIAGLALVIVSFVGPWARIDDLSREVATFRGDIQILALEAKQLEAERKAASTPESAVPVRPSPKVHALGVPEPTPPPTELLRNREKALELRKAQIEAKRLLLREQSSRIKMQTGLGAAGSLVGVILTFSGFALWYVRVQRFQDAILARKAAAVAQPPPPGEPQDETDDARDGA